jgi:general secretion pathway protein E
VCSHSGFKGRTGIYELMTTNVKIRELIHQRASESLIRQAAGESGMLSLREDSQRWIDAKLTTLEEVMMVTGMDQMDL